jgi:hypothetical protein
MASLIQCGMSLTRGIRGRLKMWADHFKDVNPTNAVSRLYFAHILHAY